MASKFWLIAAPPMPTPERAYEIVEEKTSRSLLSKNTKFVVPSLKVGTMDSLMSLSDDLVKVDNFVESTTRRIGANLLSILADGQAAKDDRPANQILQINGASVETWISRFQWMEAKYPVKNSCRELTEQIQGQVGRIEEELRVKAADYSNIVQSLHASERKRVGTLAVRDVADLIKPSDIHVSEYLTTLFVVVPKFSYREWESCYETLVSDRVVPRSSTLIYEDNDNGLWNVVLFKIVADEFRGKCRERKFTVREVNLEESNVDGSVAHQQLIDEKERQKNRLLLWCKANFSEAFIAWIHLKAIRVHVESILRYGLPPVYQAILMQPQLKQEKKLRTALGELFSHLTASMGSMAGDEDILGLATPEEFFPYVYLEVETDVTARTSA